MLVIRVNVQRMVRSLPQSMRKSFFIRNPSAERRLAHRVSVNNLNKFYM